MSKSSFSLLPLPFSGGKYEGEGLGMLCFPFCSAQHASRPIFLSLEKLFSEGKGVEGELALYM